MKVIGNPFHTRAFEELIRPLMRTNAPLKLKTVKKTGKFVGQETGVRRLKRGKEQWALTTEVRKKTNNQQEYRLELSLVRSKVRFQLPWTENMLKALSGLRMGFISWMRKTPQASGWLKPITASDQVSNDQNSQQIESSHSTTRRPATATTINNKLLDVAQSSPSRLKILKEGEPMELEVIAKGYTPAQKKKRQMLTTKIDALRLSAKTQLKELQKMRAKLAPLRERKRNLRKQGKKATPALQAKINKLMPKLERALERTRQTREKIEKLNSQIRTLKKAAGFKVPKKKKKRVMPTLKD